MLKDENMNKGREEMIESLEQEIVQEYMNKSGINMALKIGYRLPSLVWIEGRMKNP